MITWGWILSIVGGLGSLVSGIVYAVAKDDYTNRAYSFYSSKRSDMEVAQIFLFVFLAVLVLGIILLVAGYVSKSKKESAMRTEMIMRQLINNQNNVPQQMPPMQTSMQMQAQPYEPKLSELEKSKGCPNCGFRNENTAKFCNKCGFDLTKMRTEADNATSKGCPECGARNSKTAKFCNKCGYKFVIKTPKKCKSCGFENEPNASYCRNCDQKL